MNEPKHQPQGRLRLRLARLKYDTARLAAASAALRLLVGIVSVETNPFTGGIVMRYDVRQSIHPAFWMAIEDVLQTHGLYRDSGPLRHSPAAPATSANAITDRVADAFVDSLNERATRARGGDCLAIS